MSHWAEESRRVWADRERISEIERFEAEIERLRFALRAIEDCDTITTAWAIAAAALEIKL
jgi:hypothetical protein